jgi:hypothetical protein
MIRGVNDKAVVTVGEMVLYQYWRHKATGETYAVRLDGRQVTGVRELAPASARDPNKLPDYDYDDDPHRCRWLEERGSEFLLTGQSGGPGFRQP